MGENVQLEGLAQQLSLGALLGELTQAHGGYEILAHWQQGEFHHDLVLRVDTHAGLPAAFLVVATNCNGGVKEVLAFDERPDRSALWHLRCPDNPAFNGALPPLRGRALTLHWFDPCERLLRTDARSEYRAEFREPEIGGGWRLKPEAAACRRATGPRETTR